MGRVRPRFATTFLRTDAKVLRFLNADELARGLSPLEPQAVAIRAGKLLISEVHDCLRRKESFALESTLSGKTYFRLSEQAREAGYRIELH